jgi:hypothetical protein
VGVTALATRDGVLDATDRRALDDLARRIATGEPKVLLHLHGGLVDERAAREMATRLSGTGEQSYNAPDGWEQVYVVWRTGLLETLSANWRDLATNDRLYRTLVRRLIAIVSDHVGTPAVGSRSAGVPTPLSAKEVDDQLRPGVERPFEAFDAVRPVEATGRGAVIAGADDSLKMAVENDPEIESEAQSVEAAIAGSMPIASRAGVTGDPVEGTISLRHLDADVRLKLQMEAAGQAATRGIFATHVVRRLVTHAVAIGLRVLERYRRGRDHGIHATVVEEIARELYGDLIGSIIWGMMKQDAADHFAPGRLGDALLRAIAANPKTRVVIVGHSAGSIFATELLLWAARESVPLKADVVLLAPAVRMQRFAQALDAAEDRIGRFRLYAMQDGLERADALLGAGKAYIYPSSLLYLVSGLFEEHGDRALSDAPLVGMQRFLEGATSWDDDDQEGAAIRRVRDFLTAGDCRTVLSKVTGGPGLSSDATSHGGFDDEKATLESVATFLA